MTWDQVALSVFVVGVAPIFVAWCRKLSLRRSEVSNLFRPVPPLRAIYPGMAIASLLAEYYYTKDLWHAGHAPGLMDYLALGLMLGIFLVCVIMWPPTVSVTADGLRWDRLLRRRFIPWAQIESAYSGMGSTLVIFANGGQRFELGLYVEGRTQLKDLIKKRMTELHGSDARVR